MYMAVAVVLLGGLRCNVSDQMKKSRISEAEYAKIVLGV